MLQVGVPPSRGTAFGASETADSASGCTESAPPFPGMRILFRSAQYSQPEEVGTMQVCAATSSQRGEQVKQLAGLFFDEKEATNAA